MTWFRKDPEIHWVEKGQHDIFSQMTREVRGEW